MSSLLSPLQVSEAHSFAIVDTVGIQFTLETSHLQDKILGLYFNNLNP